MVIPSDFTLKVKYPVFLNDKMIELIEKGLVQVASYEDDGNIPPQPFVELQTNLEKTKIDYCEFVDKFNTIEEANLCAKTIADYLKIPYKFI